MLYSAQDIVEAIRAAADAIGEQHGAELDDKAKLEIVRLYHLFNAAHPPSLVL